MVKSFVDLLNCFLIIEFSEFLIIMTVIIHIQGLQIAYTHRELYIYTYKAPPVQGIAVWSVGKNKVNDNGSDVYRDDRRCDDIRALLVFDK